MRRSAGFLSLFVFSAVLWIACTSEPSSVAGPSHLAGGIPAVTAQCVGTQKDETAPFSLTAPAGQVVASVCIKSGTNTFTFIADGTDGCYTVVGIGTPTVTVTGGGTSRDCQEISHISITTEPGHTPTPTPTPTPTSTPTS